jgi:hypothetical protein
MNTYGKNTLAYFDSITGLIPVKVDAITDDMVSAHVTARRYAYPVGEIIIASHHRIIPRKSVYVRDSQYRIRHNYEWKG